jgi:hypothetical protein
VREYTARAAIGGWFHADAPVRTTGRPVNAELETVAWVVGIRSAPWTGKVLWALT